MTGHIDEPEQLAASPVIPGYFADPNLVIFDDTYFLYPTTDGSDGWSATSFRAFSSRDLVTWIDHGEIFSVARDTSWAEGHAWAPGVVRKGDRYYLYYTAESNIGVAVADSPTGPFVDIGAPLVAHGDYTGRAIDPSVFLDDDGSRYLYWGNGIAHGVRLNDDMISFERQDVVSWYIDGFREAPWVHRNDGTYYLSWSENDTREADYRVRYATSAGPLGPWTPRGLLLEKHPEQGIYATGHHSILRIPGSNDWVIAYHRFAIPDGNGYRREIAIDRLTHDSTGSLHPVKPARSRLRIELS